MTDAELDALLAAIKEMADLANRIVALAGDVK